MKNLFDRFIKGEIINILAIVVVIGCFITLLIMMFKEVPQSNKDIVNNAISFMLGSAMTGVIGYYFGASKKEVEQKTNV